MSLPMKLKMGLRDNWDNPSSDVQKAIAKLKETLGHPINITPQWQLLWTDLESVYSDAGTFVPSVAAVVAAWCSSIETLLEKEENEEWADTALDKMASSLGVNLRLEVDGKAKRPTTTWTKEKSCFTLCMPKVRLPSTSIIVAGLSEDLLGAFSASRSTLPLHGITAGASDDWADVQVDSSTGHAQAVDVPQKRAETKSTEPIFLPTADALQRPEELLLQPPYHALVQWRGSELEIHCSHGAALQLLRDYLDRWARQNFRDVRHPPSIEIVLEESPIGLGLLFNRLLIRPQSRNMSASQTLSPVIVLPFIESVLGFTMVSSEAGLWHYRRDGELRKL